MLTVYYLAATWVQSWRLNSILQKLRAVTEKHGSIVVHHELSTFSLGIPNKHHMNSLLSNRCLNYKSSHIADLLWYQNNKKAVSVFPKQILDVSGWIYVLKRKTHLPIQFEEMKSTTSISRDELFYVLVEANYLTCSFKHTGETIQLERYGRPLAWHASDRISLLMETSEKDLSQLMLKFLLNNLSLENGVQILRIITVEPLGSPYKINNDQTVPETYAQLNKSLSNSDLRNDFLDRWRAHVSMLCTFCEAISQVKDSQQDISVRHPGSGVGAVKLVPSNEPIGINHNLLGSAKSVQATNEVEMVSVVTQQGAQTPDNNLSGCSSGQSSQISSEILTGQGSTRQAADSITTSMSSIRSLPSTPRRTICSTPVHVPTKPPNVLIISDSSSASESVKSALEATLINDRYVLHNFTFEQMLSSAWLDDSVLVVVHGNIPPSFIPVLVNYLAKGSASLLCLCSDFLGNILPLFHTAEVRPNELVLCSYKSWKHIPLIHHVLCYQPTPCDPKFSYDEHASLTPIPESVDMTDSAGKTHKLKIQVLGVEETWQTPSLLLVTLSNVMSKIVFSQVHLEVDPDNYTDSDSTREALQRSDKDRLEILSDVLSNHLDLKCASKKSSSTQYSLGYFLGNHEAKQLLLDKLRQDNLLDNNTMTSGMTKFKFCGKGVSPPSPSETMLPILIYSCPGSFSTVEYFENLKTESLGRLVVFSEVMTSCLTLIENLTLTHGIAFIPHYQTRGQGRGGNTWLSLKGCAMFAVQLHIPIHSYIGQHLPILQFLATLAMVSSICELPFLEELDIGIKWPNDIYVNKSTKIGGVVVKTKVNTDSAIFTLGCALNLNNAEPTVCLNDIIAVLGKEKKLKIPPITMEKYFATVFNKLEELVSSMQNNGENEFYQSYYRFWLHSEAEVKIVNKDGTTQLAKIKGIDDYGFLIVENAKGESIVVQPDGNSFDMMTGLISPKMCN